MATNEIQGSKLLREFSFDNRVTWKTLVCEQGGTVNSDLPTSLEDTKCGPIPSLGTVTWTMDGDAVGNFAPTASECSLTDVMAALANKTKLDARVQSPPHDAVLIGAEYFRQGEGYFTSAKEDMGNGSVVKFSWTFTGVGHLSFAKILGFYLQPLTPVAVAVGSTLAISAVSQGGQPPYTYQWKKGGVDISGATSSSYSKANAQVGDSGTYTVVVTDDAAATATSSGSVVTVS